MKSTISLTFILLFSFQAGFSCSCFYEAMSVKKINQYDLVFKGKVLKKEKVGDIMNKNKNALEGAFQMEYFKYTFDVIDRVKLFTKANTMVVYSSTQGASCGVNYNVGDELYIFSYKSKDSYMTGLCTNNVHVANVDKKFMKVVDQYKKPKKRSVWKDEKCNLVAEGKFADGKPDGIWTYYNPDGTIQSKGKYNNGLKEGIWLSYLDKEGSKEYYEILSEEQKSQVVDVNNIIDGQEVYKDGKRKKTNHRFVIGGY